jgi:hypothetical protein
MKPLEKKSINILSETHRAISFESVRTGKDMYVLMAEAWDLYERERDEPAAEKVVAIPAATKRDPHSVAIPVPPEIAKDVQRIVNVLRAPGALEQFNALMRALAEGAMADLAKSFTATAAGEKKRR